MSAQIIIVAAGSGTRFKSAVPKALVPLQGRPLVAYSLDVFDRMKGVTGIVVVGHPAYLVRFKTLAKRYSKVYAVVPGGATRAGSVKCGLSALCRQPDHVLVHDAARPLVDTEMTGRVLAALKQHKAAIAAVPVKATIKKVDPKSLMVQETPNRELLWDIQTPQGFHTDVLAKAHARPLKQEATDDAMMVEQMGFKVKVVMGDYRNIKVTTPEDLVIAQAIMRARG